MPSILPRLRAQPGPNVHTAARGLLTRSRVGALQMPSRNKVPRREGWRLLILITKQGPCGSDPTIKGQQESLAQTEHGPCLQGKAPTHVVEGKAHA